MSELRIVLRFCDAMHSCDGDIAAAVTLLNPRFHLRNNLRDLDRRDSHAQNLKTPRSKLIAEAQIVVSTRSNRVAAKIFGCGLRIHCHSLVS